ncbi:putative nucleic acid-binding Zn ribbon protein [Saccharothrix ecbatanensis]|uniref:Putative nucleic acid-binding Zn ribbon protein n=1 Tax=Saccharothrix ecbatanensis TaxID=1105145 RepID=A0A7W9HF88_9PSEU|nr:putative nucleic acid-binding Zn ribbon protein [Saccharothrix ecbatanensis]
MTTAMTTALDTITTGLNPVEDRCDRCGARARVRVVLHDGELTFCDHHERRHRAALERVAVRIEHHVDTRDG